MFLFSRLRSVIVGLAAQINLESARTSLAIKPEYTIKPAETYDGRGLIAAGWRGGGPLASRQCGL
jgi:hypothetical protein